MEPTQPMTETATYPIKLRVGKAKLADLQQEECGSWEDAGAPKPGAPWDQDNFDRRPYREGREHPYNILGRHPNTLELRDEEEAETIIGHVLDNSIDKAEGWKQDTWYRDPEYPRIRRWLNWLYDLRDRIRKAT